jgi:hypothetical protein
MKKLSIEATRIFCRLLKRMGKQTYIRLTAKEFLPLVLEQIGEVSTFYGPGKLYSLAHYYEQEGDLMRDPEMVFIVVDNRKGTTDYDPMAIYPQLFRQDNIGAYEESVCLENDRATTFKPLWQKDQAIFASQWLKNIQQQGFLR